MRKPRIIWIYSRFLVSYQVDVLQIRAVKAMHILLIEDEPKVAAFVRQGLEEEGYRTTWALGGESGLTYALQETFDLVLLDIRLPDIDGFEVCRRLRLHDLGLPILMLTALDAVEDRVKGLRVGADDYLPKPFAFDELLARIEALLRRTSVHQQESHQHRDGPLVLDPAARTCTCSDQPMNLTQKEFDLLMYFMTRKGQALHRDAIHRDVWGHDFDRGTNLIDVYVGYVRRKLQDAACTATIETVRGVGYRYRPTEEHTEPRTDAPAH